MTEWSWHEDGTLNSQTLRSGTVAGTGAILDRWEYTWDPSGHDRIEDFCRANDIAHCDSHRADLKVKDSNRGAAKAAEDAAVDAGLEDIDAILENLQSTERLMFAGGHPGPLPAIDASLANPVPQGAITDPEPLGDIDDLVALIKDHRHRITLELIGEAAPRPRGLLLHR